MSADMPALRHHSPHAKQGYFIRQDNHTYYISSRGREPTLLKTHISVQMCSFDTGNSLCAERIKTWAVSWLELCTPVGVWNDLHLHKVHAQTHTHTQSEQHGVLLHEFTTLLGLKKDYYIKPKSTPRQNTADPKWRECRAKPGAAFPDKQRGGARLHRAGRSDGRISALLHDDLLHSSSVQEHAVQIALVLAALCICCSLSCQT